MSSNSALDAPGEDWRETDAASVLALLRGHADRTPTASALVNGAGAAVDYAGLVAAVESVALRLRGAGIGRADRVVALLSGSVDSAILLLAILSIGTCVPVNPAGTEAEFQTILETVGATAVVAEVDAHVDAAAAKLGVPVLRYRGREAGDQLDGQKAPTVSSGDELPAGTLLLRTSGTTAGGKLVPLTWPTMLGGAAASARAYGLGPADRRLNIMPMFHVQAVVGSLLCSLWAGSSVAMVSSFSPTRVLDMVADLGISWFSATPTMHRQILEAAPPSWRRPASLRFVRVGSSALTGQLRAGLEEFYAVPVVESYGMTEAHQIASVPLPDGTSAAGLIPTGSRIAILDSAGEPVGEPGVRGEIVVSGPNVIREYLWPAEENERAFTHGWFRTGDAGELLPDGSLRIVGRIKELINRGGEKISPSEVEVVLLDHPAVAEAAVFAVPDEVWTEQVAAAVVLRPGLRADAAELREFARTRLAAFKVPYRIVFRQSLPLTDTGKVSRRLLTQELAAEGAPPEQAAPARPDRVPPRTGVEAALTGMWAHALNKDGVGVEDDFFALGGESLQAVALLAMVEEVFGVEIEPLTLFDDVTTVRLMARLIQKQ